MSEGRRKERKSTQTRLGAVLQREDIKGFLARVQIRIER